VLHAQRYSGKHLCEARFKLHCVGGDSKGSGCAGSCSLASQRDAGNHRGKSLGDIAASSPLANSPLRDDAGVRDRGKLGRDDSIIGFRHFRGTNIPRPLRKEISPGRRATALLRSETIGLPVSVASSLTLGHGPGPGPARVARKQTPAWENAADGIHSCHRVILLPSAH
jgi:hypothetical protein